MNLKYSVICEVAWVVFGVFGAGSALIDYASWKVLGRGIHSGKGKV
jgi:hypothetical protein